MNIDLFPRMTRTNAATIDVASMICTLPETDIVLPPNKIVSNYTMPIYQVQAAVITISRDAFNLGAAIDRLETVNNHARHLVIDRTGRIYQAASLTSIIRHIHMVNSRDLDIDNTISIELINSGVILEKRVRHKRLTLRSNDGRFEHKLTSNNVVYAPDGYYYETFPHEQCFALVRLIEQLRELQPYMSLMSGSLWKSTSHYSLTPAFPFDRFGIRR